MKVNINKSNFNRVLLTEVLPYEVPMLFSNEGFYKIATKNEHVDIFKRIKDVRSQSQYGIPFNYVISKGIEGGTRLLSVMHPFNQFEVVQFYERYDTILQYNCQQSPFSLRKIDTIAKQSYSSDLVFEDDDTLKSAQSDVVSDEDKETMVYRSFFRYEPIDLIYKFYDRFDYRRLEQKFTYLLKFDISKCFYNIYTHSITWAVKGKTIAKRRSGTVSFENTFDKVMQQTNYNETNGIIVGPEVSRLFAEIVLTKIDKIIYSKLKEDGFKQSLDYDIRRYVDDYYVYTNSEKLSKIINDYLKKELSEFKLYSNENKHEFHRTPFVTKLSVAKNEVKDIVDDFFEKIIAITLKDNEKVISLDKKSLSNPYGVANNFIKKFQYVVRRNDLKYDQINRDIVRLFSTNLSRILKKSEEGLFAKEEYGNFILAFVNVLFYCYSLGMNASSTFKTSRCIVLICKSMNQMNFSSKENLMLKIISEIDSVMNIYLSKADPNNTDVNILNLLIAMTVFEERYKISSDKLMSLFRHNKSTRRLNYFEICTLLYYIKNDNTYDELKKEIIDQILDQFRDSDRFTSSETCMLYLDMMTCPYIEAKDKRNFSRISQFSQKNTSNSTVDSEVSSIASKGYWFFNWDKDINLEAVLKSKEWSSVY